MPHVFISYSHDDEDQAFALNDRIKTSGLETFIDQPNLSPGDEWQNRIRSALDDSFAVVIVCTKSSMSSHEVTFEWSYALGQGVLVAPVIYETDCQLHSRLSVLQQLDFSHPRERPWDKLIRVLSEANAHYKPTVGFLQKAGIYRILFSREDLATSEFAITKLLQRLKIGSELLVVGRSCEAWARQYLDLENALNDKSVRIKLIMVDPAKPRDDWMIKSDYAQLDVGATLGKLKMIRINPNSEGSIGLYLLPSSPLLSFVHWTQEDDCRMGILEIGASLPLNERTSLVLRSSSVLHGVLLQRLYKVYSLAANEAAAAYDSRAEKK